jgi:hypothetical protein
MMKLKLLFVMAMFVAASAHAQTASTESIEELLVVTKSESLMNTLYGNIESIVRQGMNESLKGKTLDANQRALVDSMPAKMSKVLREELSWSSLKPMYVQIYKESLTQEDVSGLIDFYKSPAGAAMINKMPLVMQKSMVMVQQRMGPLMEKMQEALKQSLVEARVESRP